MKNILSFSSLYHQSRRFTNTNCNRFQPPIRIQRSFTTKIDPSFKIMSQYRPIVIVGPSGVGKGTLIDKLMKEHPSDFGFSVSHTTRKPRAGEVDGVHYHFTDVQTIQSEIQEGKFVEHANVHGNYYGTSRVAVNKVAQEGKICILDIDVQGAEQVKKTDLNARFVFVAPPSSEELEKRLRGRGTETEEAISKRLSNSKKEIGFMESNPSFFDLILVNKELETAYSKLKSFIGIKGSDGKL